MIAVVTGKDVAERAAPLPSFGAGPIVQDMIAIEKVRHYGETVAAVIAENRYIAEDACDLIEVDYEPLPVVLDPFEAREEGAPLVHEALGTNTAYERTFSFGEVDQAFADADRSVSAELLLAALDGHADGHERRDRRLRPGHGRRHDLRQLDELHVLPVADRRLAEDPGEQAPARARRRGRQLRLEVLHAQGADVRGLPLDGRRQAGEVRRGPDHAHRQQRPLRLRPPLRGRRSRSTTTASSRRSRISCVDDYGAYLQFGTGTHGNALSQIVGPYRIQHVEYSLAAVLTNKNQQGAYRGFGAEVSNWMLERLVDMAARELGLDRVEIRRRNLIPAGRVPVPDADREHLRQRQLPGRAGEGARGGRLRPLGRRIARRARAEGRHVGIGVVASQERSVFSSTEFWFWFDDPQFTPTSSPESASVQIDPTGQIVVTLHSQSLWGNSPETVVSQVVAEEFDVDPASIVVTYADSQNALPGTGPGGSRYTVMVSGAVAGAASELKDKIRRIASDKLEVAEADLEFRDGGVGVVGVPDRHLTLAEIALTAYMFRLDLPPDMPSGLAAQSTYDHPLTTLPNADRSDLGIFYPFVGHAWHIAVVEVDPETGRLDVPPLCGRSRRGHDRQPADARRPGDRRHGTGARHGALRGDPLRRRGPGPQRELRALPPAVVDGRARR